MSSAALAQADSHVSITHIQYTLTDLDPLDNIAPTLTWGEASSSSLLGETIQTGTDGQRWATPIFSESISLQNTLSGPLGTSTGVSAPGYQASTGPEGAFVSASAPMGAEWGAMAGFKGAFTLSANTAVTFSAQSQGAIAVTVPSDAPLESTPWGYEDNGYMDWTYILAFASASIDLNSQGRSVGENTSSLNIYLRSNRTASISDDRLISNTWANRSGESLVGVVAINANANGYTVAPRVPEASTWAQMGLGLVGMALLVSHRQRSAPLKA
ncbi:MAG TPA: hypothetical protein VFW84_06750 [Aquabacterium sp.]|uniref:hypothetical protein n=1 Tax=Aquabacterium sp. TaxID=1872578 RepID=UPI002E3303F1|nr:hypothetical protein [Aquabacterium sp.]HEX5372417.1 hypothetical protein [Aquabacterium sp.]